jgi:hypothetical protein
MTKDTEYENMASLEQSLHAISGTIDDALAWASALLLKLETNRSQLLLYPINGCGPSQQHPYRNS